MWPKSKIWPEICLELDFGRICQNGLISAAAGFVAEVWYSPIQRASSDYCSDGTFHSYDCFISTVIVRFFVVHIVLHVADCLAADN